MGKGKKKERSFIKHDSSTQNNDNAKKKEQKSTRKHERKLKEW
jgi:hypothetical protein